MTVSELYNSVAQLGFEDSLEDDSRFIFAANRALLQVNALRPATSAYVINHKPMLNKVLVDTFTPIEKATELFFYANDVKAFYFEADGNGTVYFERYNESTAKWVGFYHVEFEGNGGFVPQRGHIKDKGEFVTGAVRMHFVGEYLYSVKCVAMYEHLYSANENDVPAYEAFIRYDISDLATDFLSLASPPIIEGEGITHLNQGYDVENGRIILLPYSARGVFKVIYNKRPNPIVDTGASGNDDTVINLDDELCALLPILVASYVWMDDEPEKAQYYLMLYNERAVDIERRKFKAAPIQMKSVNGW